MDTYITATSGSPVIRKNHSEPAELGRPFSHLSTDHAGPTPRVRHASLQGAMTDAASSSILRHSRQQGYVTADDRDRLRHMGVSQHRIDAIAQERGRVKGGMWSTGQLIGSTISSFLTGTLFGWYGRGWVDSAEISELRDLNQRILATLDEFDVQINNSSLSPEIKQAFLSRTSQLRDMIDESRSVIDSERADRTECFRQLTGTIIQLFAALRSDVDQQQIQRADSSGSSSGHRP